MPFVRFTIPSVDGLSQSQSLLLLLPFIIGAVAVDASALSLAGCRTSGCDVDGTSGNAIVDDNHNADEALLLLLSRLSGFCCWQIPLLFSDCCICCLHSDEWLIVVFTLATSVAATSKAATSTASIDAPVGLSLVGRSNTGTDASRLPNIGRFSFTSVALVCRAIVVRLWLRFDVSIVCGGWPVVGLAVATN